MAKKAVGFGLVAGAIGFEPLDNIGIETHGDGRLFRAIKLADFGAAPINDGGNVRKINVPIFLRGDGRDVLLLVLCELLHRPGDRRQSLQRNARSRDCQYTCTYTSAV